MTPMRTVKDLSTVAPSLGLIQYTPFLPSLASARPGVRAKDIAAPTAPPRSARRVLMTGTEAESPPSGASARTGRGDATGRRDGRARL